jgi:hypothetical protein
MLMGFFDEGKMQDQHFGQLRVNDVGPSSQTSVPSETGFSCSKRLHYFIIAHGLRLYLLKPGGPYSMQTTPTKLICPDVQLKDSILSATSRFGFLAGADGTKGTSNTGGQPLPLFIDASLSA